MYVIQVVTVQRFLLTSVVRCKYMELCRTVGFRDREIRTARALYLRTKK